VPNGRPGDNPYDDIIHHGGSEYGEPVDGLVRELSKMPGFANVSGEVASILWEHSPMHRQKEKPKLVAAVLEKLQSVKQGLARVK
jgi:hypothetical protein